MTDNSIQQADVTAPESTETATVETVETPSQEEQQEPKTFTQEELDRIVSKEKAKERRRLEREQQQRVEATQQPSSSNAPKPEAYATPEEYGEAYAEWKNADQQVRQRVKQVESTYLEREEAAREKYSDFQEVAYNDDLQITREMAAVIKESEIGPELAYHLGKNPKEAERIAGLSPLAQARELGKIEASLAANPAPAKKVTAAPDPISPVGSRASVPALDPSDPRSSKMSDAEWIKARNNQIAKRSQ